MLAAILLALAAAATPPAATPSASVGKTVSPVVVTPEMKEAPPPDAVLNIRGDADGPASGGVSLWPAGAYQARAQGDVTLSCWINPEGLAEWCNVVFERPVGHRFGEAALALRPNLKVTPRKGPDGAPIAGKMNIALTFKPPESEIDAHTDPGMGLHAVAVEVTHNALPINKVTLINNPVWAKAPGFEEVARAYPAGAGGVEGFAVAHCLVRKDGSISSCKIATETPGRLGFGAAAMKLALGFQVDPAIMARAPKGEPLAVDVPVRFAAPTGEKQVTAPSWLVGYDPDAAPKLFPPAAAEKGLTSGRGVARCVVRADGGMSDCAADGDDPEGLGFGQAAARLASTMKMNLWSADARPVEGGTVRIAVRLNLKAPGQP